MKFIRLDSRDIKSKKEKFISQTQFYKPYFQKYNIPVNFAGFNDTWDNYLEVDNLNLESLFPLMKDLILWKEYMCGVKNYFISLHEQELNKQDYLIANRTNRKNRILEQKIEESIEKTAFLKEYISNVTMQEINFQKACKHTKQLYDEAIEILLKS